MKKILMMSAIALLAFTTRADMTYSPFAFGVLNDASGNVIKDGTYVMVLDLDGDGWNGNGYLSQSAGDDNASSWLWDADDFLMERGQITDGDAFPFWTVSTANIPAGFTANVDNYYVLWFDTPYDALAAGPGVGINYGAENLGAVGADPGDYGPFLTGGSATFQTIPEPATAMLAVIGGGLAYFVRRGKRSYIKD
jgi:hypothetical protein